MKNIKEIIESHIPPEVELLSFNYNPHTSFIRIIIDSRKNITVDDTAELASGIKNDDFIVSNFPEGVRLEVGTPGIGSKLERIYQFEKNIGRCIELEYIKRNDVLVEVCQLLDVIETGIIVEHNKNKSNISFDKIKSAKIKVAFD
tara:strand:- start:445 stop:879 length:435 start_codon:yes stop_codon:yes gene_type:complete